MRKRTLMIVILAAGAAALAQQKAEPDKPQSAAAAKESTAKPALCEFIEKVRAAQADDFAAIRTEQADKIFGNYEGKLTPDAQTTCNVWPHQEVQGRMTRALYACQMRRAKTMAEIKPEYERIKAELQACDAGLRFKEGSKGSEKTHDETWYFVGANDKVRVTVQALDNRFMIDTAAEMVNETTKQTPASLTLSIRALQ
ncbi:MAG: hypothetical protein LAN84_08265 [Acidobacteriia bacterium]|nr:hypothetical protein [Terriglobia bacterium]